MKEFSEHVVRALLRQSGGCSAALPWEGSACLEFLGIENRPLERNVHPSNVWERGPAPPSPSLSSCPSFSFYHSMKGNTLPQRDGPTFLHYRWQAAPPPLAANTTTPNPGLPTLQPAVSNASGFIQGESNFGKAPNSTPPPLHTHSSAHLTFSVPPPLLKSFQNPSEVSWLMAASVHLRLLQLGQTLQRGTATLLSSFFFFLSLRPGGDCCWFSELSVFCLQKCGTLWLLNTVGAGTCSAGRELRIYSPINQHCHV